MGNPGGKYRNTRHSIGFQFIDYLLNRWNIDNVQKKFSSIYSEYRLTPLLVILLKPQTFINLSGRSIKSALLKNGLDCADLIVIHDEVEMEPGKWGKKQGGGHKGHNGLRDIISATGDNDFLRFRIGVGRPQHPDLASYLLAKMPQAAKERVMEIFPKISEALEKELNNRALSLS